MKYQGVIQKQSGRGRHLGYPTANIKVPEDAEEGIFAGYTYVDGEKYRSIIFVGQPLTFGETEKKAESYILNFEGNLYGLTAEFELLEKIRDNRKFDSESALIEAMKQDEIKVREFFERTSKNT